VTKEWQSASGAVGEGTPVIEYLYDAPSGEEITKAPRRIGIKYSETYTLNFNYDEGLDDNISRLSSFSETIGETTSFVEGYKYLGSGTVVARTRPTGVGDLSYIATGPGDAGDKYVGLDRFGRVVDQNWNVSGTANDRFQYTYDRERHGFRLGRGP